MIVQEVEDVLLLLNGGASSGFPLGQFWHHPGREGEWFSVIAGWGWKSSIPHGFH